MSSGVRSDKFSLWENTPSSCSTILLHCFIKFELNFDGSTPISRHPPTPSATPKLVFYLKF
ncbi:hypothetical protein BpHYR1_010739 [Brachionus plicatilis]|uniref:Uncharacterized protein n=1 Tax=Brachionus plicatilis TaxID=10195 RepID=A0A3M7SYL5_BRAPC|nr:hypothetical protein BpHYR1_010739 [Brachionus plicatilis]